MQSEEYTPDAIQRQALNTWFHDGASLREQRIHALLGLAGETGELVDVFKKHFYKPGYEATQDKVKDELSDVLYYVAVLSHLWGFSFEDMTAHLAIKLAGGHGWAAGEAGTGEPNK
ncbi:MAG: hypothetical protein KBF17_04040 [Candidatus Promineofilum sp.]|nr:hypothetical protein [Promineifilum sp.]MBP9656376.1 hypothetical protein [Promineifilum sp.]